MKKEKKTSIKKHIYTLLQIASVFLVFVIVLGVPLLHGYTEVCFSSEKQQLYTATGKCTESYEEPIIWFGGKFSHGTVYRDILAIDGVRYVVSKVDLSISSPNEYENLVKSCKIYGVTVEYNVCFLGERHVNSLVLLEDGTSFSITEDRKAHLLDNLKDFGIVGAGLLFVLFVLLSFASWFPIKGIYTKIKKKSAKAKRKAERAKMFSEQDTG